MVPVAGFEPARSDGQVCHAFNARLPASPPGTGLDRRRDLNPRLRRGPDVLPLDHAESRSNERVGIGDLLVETPHSSQGWTRTTNSAVNSRVLCQLSYLGKVFDAWELNPAARAGTGLSPNTPIPYRISGHLSTGIESRLRH